MTVLDALMKLLNSPGTIWSIFILFFSLISLGAYIGWSLKFISAHKDNSFSCRAANNNHRAGRNIPRSFYRSPRSSWCKHCYDRRNPYACRNSITNRVSGS